MQTLNPSRSSVLEPPRSKASADCDAERKQKLGQFLTPESIGAFMASLFEARPAEVRLLDAGAGEGALIAEFVVEPTALALVRTFGTKAWPAQLKEYLANRVKIRQTVERERNLARIPVKLPSGKTVTLSPGGQNPLIKQVIEEFCPRFAPGATVVYIGDAESKFLHLEAAYLEGLGIVIAPSAKMPDVVVHDTQRNWLLLVEAVMSAGAVDWKRRNELKDLFRGCKARLVFVTAFETRHAMQSFLPLISWETEVWVAEAPDHLIHFDGERFLGPYPDVMPGSHVKKV